MPAPLALGTLNNCLYQNCVWYKPVYSHLRPNPNINLNLPDTKSDINFPGEDVDGKVTVQRLRDDLAAEYDLPGRISLHRSDGEELSDPFARIGDIVAVDKCVRLRYDDTVAVANGGIAHGGHAYASGGRKAFAAGGFAGGGNFYPDGSAEGGMGRGGDIRADYGRGGDVMGGGANNPGGEAKAGDKYAGKAIKNPVPPDAGETEKNEKKRSGN